MGSDKLSEDKAPYEELTWRELEVLAMLAERLTNREIANRLHFVESTIKDYVSNILGKLYVKNRRQAVERATAFGLLDPARETVAPKTNLPAETTPFVGRMVELEEIKEQLGVTRLLTLTGPIVSLRDKDFLAAERFATDSLNGSEAIEDMTVKALSLNALGHLAQWRADYPNAKDYYLRSLNTTNEIGFRWAIGNATKYLGQVALLSGEIFDAERYFLRGLKIADELGLDRDIANHLFEFARLRATQERKEEAVEILALLLQLPASNQARLGSGWIREAADPDTRVYPRS